MKVLNDCYPIDAGNGFTKRRVGDKILVESSVIGERTDFYNRTQYTSLSLDNETQYYVGNDAIESGVDVTPALGDDDEMRYRSKEFDQLMYGFMGKDFQQSTEIPLLVTGLPVNHYLKQASYLMKKLKGSKIVYVNNEEIILHIKDVHVLPQPLGTYMYLVATERIDPNARVTVIDGGYGTLDVTELKGQNIIKRAGGNIGVKIAYEEILTYLIDEFGSRGTNDLTLSKMPYILAKGFQTDGQIINIAAMPKVQNILNKHFDKNFKFVRDHGFDLSASQYVIWTGGMAQLHADRIAAKERKNFIILEDGQEANVKGYDYYAKSVLAG
ncbi:ParM/StbA family protein [Parageobacillus thermoglucosidasius]|uniref:ParM/StbA family protein n=1 Tax=Parageobacillus thermoglucosidasius TaxID=1426 RepID=UPI002E1DD827|nr:ParM/StbA family protein [Parageobacillus thermoglucosidasius]MED4946534.1 ParM/StbA family protein [Parageobacillus thermoglucosidasius]MED4984913.1 ParM/StbA family protein [Parageobacillus thermoglucosidasius]